MFHSCSDPPPEKRAHFSRRVTSSSSFTSSLQNFTESVAQVVDFTAKASHGTCCHGDLVEDKAETFRESQTLYGLLANRRVPYFKDFTLENLYVNRMGRRNKRMYCKALFVATVFLLLAWLPWGMSHQWDFNAPDVVLICGCALQLLGCISMPFFRFVPQRLLAQDTLCICLALLLVLTFFGTDLPHVGYFVDGDPWYFDENDRDCHSTDLLSVSLIMVVVLVHHFFSVRASRSWIIPALSCIFYAATSFVPGLKPSSFRASDRLHHLVALIAISGCAWIGRCNAEYHDRISWSESRALANGVLELENKLAGDDGADDTITVLWQELSQAIQTSNEDAISCVRQNLINEGMSCSDIDEKERSLRSKHSIEAGIALSYLLSSEFANLAKSKTGQEDPTFYDIGQAFFFDEEVGRSQTCPRDGGRGCAFIDWVNPEHRRPATHFLSWLWSYRLSMVTSGLRTWAASENLQPAKIFLYMCFFVNNQYRILVDKEQSGADNLDRVFEVNMRRIGKVVALLDTWHRPAYLSRIWTIFEQLTAIAVGLPVTMALPPEAVKELIEEFEKGKQGILRVKCALSSVDSASAKASVQSDEIKVKAMIRDTIGFEAVNEKVASFMIHWVAAELQSYMSKLVFDPGKRVLPLGKFSL